ncbi:YdeI family protein [Spirosoma sp. KNUC1025]|uniref:YdeI/OmpD-associated family protein n=1 Tax=Spirosoma sp. KNUC1025 TaxID=2894082 RepID=UPI003867B8E2|nr:hypothetical protein LN737_23305 [Spirosoma sp. KNUC1025]
METKDGIPTFFAQSTDEWRDWLAQYGQHQKSVYLIIYKKGSNRTSIKWHDAIEHALSFGWVDSKAVKRDEQSVYLKFTPRHPKSQWGPMNKKRAQKLIDAGLMRPEGQKLIDLAMESGNW